MKHYNHITLNRIQQTGFTTQQPQRMDAELENLLHTLMDIEQVQMLACSEIMALYWPCVCVCVCVVCVRTTHANTVSISILSRLIYSLWSSRHMFSFLTLSLRSSSRCSFFYPCGLDLLEKSHKPPTNAGLHYRHIERLQPIAPPQNVMLPHNNTSAKGTKLLFLLKVVQGLYTIIQTQHQIYWKWMNQFHKIVFCVDIILNFWHCGFSC